MLLLVLCWCETNMDTVLRFVKLASSFHILHCFNELCNVTIQFCMFTRSSLKNVTVKKPWDVDNVKVWLLQAFDHRKVLSKMLIVKKYCKLIKKCKLKGNNISKKLNFALLLYHYQIEIYKISTYQKYNIFITCSNWTFKS